MIKMLKIGIPGIMITLVVGTLLVGMTGCASSYHRSSTTQTTAQPATTNEAMDQPQPPTVTTTSTETVVEKKSKPHGLIGGFFAFIGDVVAFPFRVIAGVFDAVF